MFLTYIQAIKSVEHPGFRKILLYAGQDRLTDRDLDTSAGSFDKIVKEIQVCDYHPIPRPLHTYRGHQELAWEDIAHL